MSKANTRVIDLPSKQNPTGNEQVYIATENSDEKISLGEMREFMGQEFARKSENLADVNAEMARNHLSVYGKNEIDATNREQDEKISAIEQKNTEQQGKIEENRQKIGDIEGKNTEQDGKIEEIEAKNAEQDGRLQQLETTTSTTTGRVENLENSRDVLVGKVTTVEQKNEEQDEKISAVEIKNTEQDTKITAIERKNTEQDTEMAKKMNIAVADGKFAVKNHRHTVSELTDFSEKTFELLQQKLVAGQNVNITQENGKMKITSIGGGGGGGGGGDMLKSVYDTNNDGKVDTAKVADSAIVAQTAQSVDWQVIRGKPATFPASSHTHSVAEVNGLQAVLDGKAPTNHTHTVTQITGLQNALDGKMGRFVEVRVETAWNVVAKVGTTTAGNYRPQRGDVLLVTFVNGTDVSRPTLNIDGSGAKSIRAGYYDVGNNMLRLERRANSNVPTLLWYDGEYYQMFGAGHNYSYGEIPEAEISNANATPSRAITGRRIAKMKEYFEQNVPNPTANTHAVNKGYMDGRMQGLVTSAQLTQGLQDKAGLNEENLFTKKQKFSDSNDDVVDYYVKIDGNVPCVEMGGGDYEKVTYGVNEEGIVMSVNDTNVLASDDRSISLIQDNIYWSPVVSNIGSVTYPKIQVLNNEDAYTSLGVKDPNTFYFIKQ